jgi:hypothetical protein
MVLASDVRNTTHLPNGLWKSWLLPLQVGFEAEPAWANKSGRLHPVPERENAMVRFPLQAAIDEPNICGN